MPPKKQENNFWRPSNGIILLPKSYRHGDTYPSAARRNELERRGYGTCSFEAGLNRAWTREELEAEIVKKYPQMTSELQETGIAFARVKDRKIDVHNFRPDDNVAGLEKNHGKGILVLLLSQPNIVQVELKRVAECRGIKIAHLNTRSLRPKILEIRALLHHRTDIDVVTFSETWLKPGIADEEISVPGYTVLARRDGACDADRNPRGGVLTYVKESLSKRFLITECKDGLEESLEVCCIEVSPITEKRKCGEEKVKPQTGRGSRPRDAKHCKQALRILNVYIPPGTRNQIKWLQDLKANVELLMREEKSCIKRKDTQKGSDTGGGSSGKSGTGGSGKSGTGGSGRKVDKVVGKNDSSVPVGKCSCKTNYIILGDFNCDMSSLDEDMRSTVEAKVKTLQEMEKSCQMKQLISQPTRVQRLKGRVKHSYTTSKTMIDLIYASTSIRELDWGVVPIAMSDHCMVYCCVGDYGREKGAVLVPQSEPDELLQKGLKLLAERDSASFHQKWDRYQQLKEDIEKWKKEVTMSSVKIDKKTKRPIAKPK